MQDSVVAAPLGNWAPLIGGIGLFLLGMRMMTDGLRLAAGQALRTILARSTRTRMRGLASGFLLTSLVQSSSAITVATIGFVNAGLLNLAQAIAITYGSNIGTTTTAWIVAVVGLRFKIGVLALPLVGLGMALRVARRNGRLGALGEALAGFGIFFLGIDTLRGAFEGLGSQLELAALVGAGPLRALLFVGIGFVLTVLMQSSSAAIAIILTAAGGGVVPLGSGAALVIGANIGTTSTAAVAAIGATPSAKRVAAGHMAFNVATGSVALALLPLLLLLITRTRELLQLDTAPEATLAAFHTVFNLLGVALLWPLTDPLLRVLERTFHAPEEDDARPRHLDRNVLETPPLALDAMVLELIRAGAQARRLCVVALRGGADAQEQVSRARAALEALLNEVGGYVQRLQRGALSVELAALLPETLRVSRHYISAAELAEFIAEARASGPSRGPAADVDRFLEECADTIQASAVELDGFSRDSLAERRRQLEASYQELKTTLLDEGSRGLRSVHDLIQLLDWLSDAHRMADQLEHAARFLSRLREAVRLSEPDPQGAGASTAAPSAPAEREATARDTTNEVQRSLP